MKIKGLTVYSDRVYETGLDDLDSNIKFKPGDIILTPDYIIWPYVGIVSNRGSLNEIDDYPKEIRMFLDDIRRNNSGNE